MKRNLPLFLANALFTIGIVSLFMGFNAARADDSAMQQRDSTATTTLTSEFTYQGYLEHNGNPVDGSCNMRFRYYPDASSVIQIGLQQAVSNVSVDDGLFAVALDAGTLFEDGVSHIEVAVDCGGGTNYVALAPRQAVTGAPYAHTLRPGASVVGSAETALNLLSKNDHDALTVDSTSGGDDGITIASADDGILITQAGDDGIQIAGATDSGVNVDQSGGIGVKVFKANQHGVSASTQSSAHYAGQFFSEASDSGGPGLFARGSSDGASDLVLGGNGGSADNGILSSDPSSDSSDLFIESNDAIVMRLDHDGSGEDADFRVEDKDENILLNVDESGDIMADYNGTLNFATPYAIASINSDGSIGRATATISSSTYIDAGVSKYYSIILDEPCVTHRYIPLATSASITYQISARSSCNNDLTEIRVQFSGPLGLTTQNFTLVVFRLD